MQFILKISFILLFAGVTSCSLLNKKNQNNIVGKGSQYIENKDIDHDRKGSDSGQIEGLKSVFFELDSSSLSSEAKEVLRSNRDWLDNNPSVKYFELEGHCDPLGSDAYNIGLGQRRAEAVKTFFKSLGVSDSKISIISYGEEKLISSFDNSLNRRVNLVPVY